MWLKTFPEKPDLAQGCVAAIGNFDGVHAGHRALLARARGVADAKELPLVVLTFDPHPRAVLRPDLDFKLLMTLEEKVAALAKVGVGGLAVLGFDKDVAAWTPERFLGFLKEWLGVRVVCVGENFRFGAKAAGDVELLKQGGFEVELVGLLKDAGGVVSSTRLRDSLPE